MGTEVSITIRPLYRQCEEEPRNADRIAAYGGSNYIGTRHILLGVLEQDSSIGAKMLKNAGVTLEKSPAGVRISRKDPWRRTAARA